jgi:hypothetical protein
MAPPKISSQPMKSSVLKVEMPGNATAINPKRVNTIPSNNNK